MREKSAGNLAAAMGVVARSALRMAAFEHDLARKHAFDLIAQVDAWCGGIQPDPADSGTADGLLARDLSAALPSLREEGRELRRHERPPLCDRAPDQAIASAPFLDHDMPRPFILAASTWAFVPSMVPIVSFGKTTEPALFSMYLRRSRTLSRRLV